MGANCAVNRVAGEELRLQQGDDGVPVMPLEYRRYKLKRDMNRLLVAGSQPGKAVEDTRTPRRYRAFRSSVQRVSVLDCASPLALWNDRSISGPLATLSQSFGTLGQGHDGTMPS